MRLRSLLMAIVCVSLGVTNAQAVSFGQTDNFEDGTTQGWSEALQSPNPPTNVSDGGPGGSGDSFLQNTSSGGVGGPGSRLAMFNTGNWAGDYLSEGVTRIRADMANFGGTALDMRVAVGSGATPPQGARSGTWYVSTDPVVLPPDGEWRNVSFGLTAADLTLAGPGTLSLTEVLSDVTGLRILSNSQISAQGQVIAATLGVDNVEAVPLPAAGWLLGSGLVGLIAAGRKRRRE